ncbi:hypothetical protein HK19_09500 [Acetobacter persici]|nr:hypothetical protein HK19_09500 [Acetobacter persici]
MQAPEFWIMERSGAGPAIVPDAPPGNARMSIFRTFLPQRCRTFFQILQNQISRSFSERGLLELGMLEGICTTLENKAQQERIRALYPASGLFGTFADADTATAMQQNPLHPTS